MPPWIWIAAGVVHLIAIADAWASQLSRGAKVLWTLLLIFLPVVALCAWLLVRGSAYRPLDPPPAPAEEDAPEGGEVAGS